MKFTKEESIMVEAPKPVLETRISTIQVKAAVEKSNAFGLEGIRVTEIEAWQDGDVRLRITRRKTIKEIWKEFWNNLLEKGKVK